MSDFPRSSMTEFFQKQEESDRNLKMNMLKAQIRDAISSIEDGDDEEAVRILKALIGESDPPEEDTELQVEEPDLGGNVLES